MQVDFQVCVRTTQETFKRLAKDRTATGQIYVKAGDIIFPEEGWDDFIVDVLTDWIGNTMLFRGSVIEVENGFIDGDQSTRVRRTTGSSSVTIGFYDRGRPVLRRKLRLRLRVYLAALRTAAEDLLGQLEQRGAGQGKDIQRLRKQLKSLRRWEAELHA